MTAPVRSGSRIPLSLQAVFLTSNRGKDVNTPPPHRVAYKTFFRGWLGRSESDSKDYKKTQGSLAKQASMAAMTIVPTVRS
jgi:hypothetical protein